MKPNPWHDVWGFIDWNSGGWVELYADGVITRAYLALDAGFDGEDEYPIPELEDEHGNFAGIYFHSFEFVRYVQHEA